MTEIHLHGLIGHKFGKLHKFVNVYKASDCFKAIDANREGFMQYLISSAQKNQHYEMIVDEESIGSVNEAFEKKQIKRIDIVPVLVGNAQFLAQVFVKVLIAAIIAGIQYLLTPIPENEPDGAIGRVAPSSYMFANRENIASQYTPVPLGYGALRVGSKVIQTIIDPVDLSSRESRQGVDLVSQQLAGLQGTEAGARAGGAY